MGISNITSMNSMSGVYMTSAASAEPKIKNIQDKIASVQQEMQKLSSKEELSITEKTDERKKLQKEVSSLNTVLKQRQEELRKSQKRELMMAQLQEDTKPAQKDASEDTIQTKGTSSDNTNEKSLSADKRQAGTVLFQNSDGSVILKDKTRQDNNRGIDTEEEQKQTAGEENISEAETKPADSDTAKDTGLSGKEAHAIASGDSSIQQAARQGTIIAQTRDGIVILKGEMNQDEMRGLDTERKQEELEKMEKREQIAAAFQFSVLGEANNRMKSALEAKMPGMKDGPQANTINNAFLNAVKTSQEEGQAEQQNFYVSFR